MLVPHPYSNLSIISAITSPCKATKRIDNLVVQYHYNGRLKYCTGRNGILLDVLIDGKRYALKCYNKPFERGEVLCDYIGSQASNRLPSPTFYRQELAVPTQKGVDWIDVSLYPWVEGRSLDFEIKRNAYNGNSAEMQALVQEFKALALDILNSPWRHGDLKPENIIVTPEGRLAMIDYDALWAPSLPSTTELGTPNFTHPLRGDNRDENIDDYAIALLLVNLHALSLLPATNITSKGMLFTAEEALGGSTPFRQAAELVAPNKVLSQLCTALTNTTTYKIPNLKELLINV